MRVRTFLGCAVILVSLAPAGAHGATMVPLKGTYVVDFLVSLASEPGPANHLHVDGSGSASAVGDSRLFGDAVLAYQDPTPCETFTAATMTLTTLSGHDLALRANGRQCYRLGLQTTDYGRIFVSGNGTFTVTGGTGPFAGATGSGAITFSGQVGGPVPGGYQGAYSPFRIDGVVSAPSTP